MFHPVIPDGRAWSKLGEHGKHQPHYFISMIQNTAFVTQNTLFVNQMTQNTIFTAFIATVEKS